MVFVSSVFNEASTGTGKTLMLVLWDIEASVLVTGWRLPVSRPLWSRSHRLYLLWIWAHKLKLPRWPVSGFCPESTASQPLSQTRALQPHCLFTIVGFVIFLSLLACILPRHRASTCMEHSVCKVCNCAHKLLSSSNSAWILQPGASLRCPN